MAEISADVLNSLAQKLESLDLSDAEQSAIDQIMERAANYQPDVEGFGYTVDYAGLASGADLSPIAFKLGGSLGFLSPKSFAMEFEGPPRP